MIRQLDKIFKLFFLWLYSDNKWINPHKSVKNNILTDRETIMYLKKNPKVGIIRYGNSELGLMVGSSPKTQNYNKNLRDKLINICRNYNSLTMKKYLLALPLERLSYGISKRDLPDWYPGKAGRLAMRFLVNKKQIYASPFCFRIINVDDNDLENYIMIVKSLFIGRKILYVGPLEGKNSDIPDFIIPSEILKIPPQNAFEKFDSILAKIRIICKNLDDPLVVIVGGTMASAISHELNMSDITCYDFGQYYRTYKKYLQTKNRNI
tara:strand:+ start:13726 stop:14520 length:795 start_codon:yes stop_codon:yes gene_type:complete